MKTTTSSEDAGRCYAGTVPYAIIELLPTRTRDTSVKIFLPAAPVCRPTHSQAVAPHSRKLPSSNQEGIPVVPDHLQVLPWIGSHQSCPPSRARYRKLRAQQIRRFLAMPRQRQAIPCRTMFCLSGNFIRFCYEC